MKLFTNLPGNLRQLFGLMRSLLIIGAVFWVLGLGLNAFLRKYEGPNHNLMAKVGIVHLGIDGKAVGLKADGPNTGVMPLDSLQGNVTMDLLSEDPALASAAFQTVLPEKVVLFIFGWFFLGLLRDLCANIERGEIFTEKNLIMVRRIGLILILSSVADVAIHFWSSWVMTAYLREHVVVTGLDGVARAGKLAFSMGDDDPFGFGDFLAGLLVLVFAEAFRQGLALKAENDLTV